MNFLYKFFITLLNFVINKFRHLSDLGIIIEIFLPKIYFR